MNRFLPIFFVFCLGASAPPNEKAEGFIPFARLLATPERYDGKKVMVFAHVVVGLEVQGAFASKESATHPSNGIWLEGDLSRYRKDEETWYQGRIAGTFHAGVHGPWSGSIGQIDRLDLDLKSK